ncbi:hypothetical protein LTS18_005623 [Coniosporium uncinatum]|uniref:Uncharacterized protein n=1 Tax=Coniosporium uncinatum TaxID=93489 RepID=A0ACC3DR87_9PEZI|nr:hypothetical protein LTS18_005623 [Coniosporium uncinatum]
MFPTTPQSPTERSFFGAITQSVRRDRSSSPSRGRIARDRSRSPRPALQTQQSTRPAASPIQPNSIQTDAPEKAKRVSSMGSSGSDFEKFSYGRHSNDWLFNGFSVRDTFKGVLDRKDS